MMIKIWFYLSLSFFTSNSLAQDNIERDLTLIANKFIEESGTVGLSIAALQGNKQLFNLSFGHINIEKNIPFTDQTVVALGSNMKVVTASYIHILKEQGKIQLDTPINNILKDKIKYGDEVSIRHLLCHTSGLPNVFGEGEFKDYYWEKATSKNKLVNQINSSNLSPKPNEKYEYNNTGYLILGWIVEDITGMSLGDYTREHFIQRLELQNTYYLGDTFFVPNISGGFTKVNGVIQKVPHKDLIEYRVAGGAGAIGGTLSDYNKWFSAIAKGTLFTSQTTKDMQTPCLLNSGEHGPEGMGIEWSEIDNEKALNGGGVANGFLSLSYYFPKYDLTIGFVGNTEIDWVSFYQQYYPKVLNWYKKYNKQINEDK
jgi:CubicO group peptidase (beta-lactamase class C family)